MHCFASRRIVLAFVLAAWPCAPDSHAAPEPAELWPTGDAACPDTPLRLTFRAPVKAGARGRIVVYRVKDEKPVDTIDLADATFTTEFGGQRLRYEPVQIDDKCVTIRLHAHSLREGESYFVRIDAGTFKDAEGGELAGIADASRWRFTVRPALKPAAKLVVAADGSGDYCTVQGAVDAVPARSPSVTEIVVRKGVYDGIIRVPAGKDRIRLVGEDRKRTVLTGRNNEKLNTGRRGRALLGVDANDFVLENLTVRNTTPHKGSQAEAVSVTGDRCVLRRADFVSCQDTLQLSGRVYVADCFVEGDVDFLWGYGSAFFEDCELRAAHSGYYVQARNPAGKAGYVFLNCKLSAAPGVENCWLARIDAGRFPASQVTYLRCRMGRHVPAAGWDVSGADVSGLRFEEFGSTDLDGKPVEVSGRHRASKQLGRDEAEALTDPARVLGGRDGWKPKASAETAQPPRSGGAGAGR